jgi:hypothetical protein
LPAHGNRNERELVCTAEHYARKVRSGPRAMLPSVIGFDRCRQFGRNLTPITPRLVSESEMPAVDDAVSGARLECNCVGALLTAAADSNPPLPSGVGASDSAAELNLSRRSETEGDEGFSERGVHAVRTYDGRGATFWPRYLGLVPAPLWIPACRLGGFAGLVVRTQQPGWRREADLPGRV